MKYEHLKYIRNTDVATLADIAIKMIAEHPDTFERIVEPVTPCVFKVGNGYGSPTYEITEAQLARFRGVCGEGQKVSCIKAIREELNIGLKEAKDLSEESAFMRAIGARYC